MRHGLALLTAFFGLAAMPAGAERLSLDHRLYPPLQAAMDNPHEGSVFYDESKAGRVLDRILVSGRSAERDWSEALELVVLARKGLAQTPQEWMVGFQPGRESPCPAQLSQLGEDGQSLTFALEASPCAGSQGLSALYRVVYGRKSVFVISAKYKGTMSAAQRQQWLALLGSARLSG